MPSLHGHELPEPVLDHLARLVERAEPHLLVKTVHRLLPHALDGIRPQARNAPLVARRVAERLRHTAGELSPKLVVLLRELSPRVAVLRALSDEAILSSVSLLAGWWGRWPLAAALLLIERETLWEPGGMLLAAPPDAVPGRDQARRALGELFQPLIAETTAWAPAEPAPANTAPEVSSPPAAGGEPKAGKQELATLRRRVQRLEKQLAKHQQQLQRAAEKQAEAKERHRAAERQWREERNTLRGRVRELERELAAARKELARERAGREAAVAAALRRELDGLCHTWLPPVLETAAEAASSRTADLLERGRELLARQAERDRHLGNRRRLRARRQELRELRASLQEAVTESLRPLPELDGLRREVEAELRRLDGLLGEADGEAAPPSPLEQRLAAALNTAATASDLTRLGDRLAELERDNLLDAAAVRRLRSREMSAWSRLYDEHPPPARHRLGPAGTWQRVLRRGKPVVLLVDGHNVLLTAADVFPGAALSAEAERRERERLIDAMESLVPLLPAGSETRLVFDGPRRHEEHPADGLVVVYSGGEGEHRADGVLLEYASFLARREEPRPVFLVTDDRDLAGQAVEAGAATIPVGLLLSLLPESG